MKYGPTAFPIVVKSTKVVQNNVEIPKKHSFAILLVGDNLIPDLTTCLISEDRNLLGEQRSDPPSQKRLICTRWGVRLVPVIITWLKRLEPHFSPAPVVNAFFLPAFLICRLFGLLGVCCDRKMLAVPRFIHRSPQMFFYVWMWVIFCFFFRGESATNNHSTNRPETERKKIVNCFAAALNNMAHLRLRFKVGMSVIWLLAKVLSSTVKETTPPPPFLSLLIKKCRKCQHIYLCLVHVPLSQTKINPCLNVFSLI